MSRALKKAARLSEEELRERFAILERLYERLFTDYATTKAIADRLLYLVGVQMAIANEDRSEEELVPNTARITATLRELLEFVAKMEPVLYRERTEFFESETYGFFLDLWSRKQTDAPAELREYARRLAPSFMVPALGTLTSVKEQRKELHLPTLGRPDFGPRIFPPEATPPTREEFLQFLDGLCDRIVAARHKLTLAEVAIELGIADRLTRSARLKDPRKIERSKKRLDIAAVRVRELLDRYAVDWVEFRHSRGRSPDPKSRLN